MGYKCERCNDTGRIPDYLGGGYTNEVCPCRKAGRKELGLTRTLAARWVKKWNGLILLSVTSDGTTGEGWIPRLKDKDCHVSDCAKSVLRSPDFRPTSGVTYRIAVLPGKLFTDKERITSKIRAEVEGRGFTKPHPEAACLIREKFSNDDLKAMGLWWLVTMHEPIEEPIEDSHGDSNLLCACRSGGDRWLDAYYGRPVVRWARGVGFAFVASQVGPYR